MTNQSIKADGKEQSLNLRTHAYFELFYKYLCVRRLLGSFSIDDGIENVTIKMNSRFFKPFRFYILQIAENAKCGRIYPSWFLVVACLRPLLIVWQNEAWRAEKIFWGAPPSPSLISGSGWPGPPLSQGLDPPLKPIAFMTYSLPSPSSLLKLPIFSKEVLPIWPVWRGFARKGIWLVEVYKRVRKSFISVCKMR